MNENIVELLLYLFENYIYESDSEKIDKKSLHKGLTQAGFACLTINDAFSWLESLQTDIVDYRNLTISPDSYRVFSHTEQTKLDTQCQDFIYYLNDSGVLDNQQREILINAVMKLDAPDFDVDDLQWLALMVLFSQPDQEQAFEHLEALMFETSEIYEH